MILTLIVTAIILVLCVLIHYELLISLSARIAGFEMHYRSAIVLAALRATASHTLHVWLFAVGYKVLQMAGNSHGAIQGKPIAEFLDWVYFSFVVYTTLGFGDMIPTGWLRFAVGVEAITGLVMIAWTASFLFFELQTQWQRMK